MKEPSLPDKVIAVHGALKRKKVGHAFGGALALAYYAEPRATIDVDLNLFLSPKEHKRVEAALALVKVSAEINAGKLERDGQIRIWWGRTPLDLFFSYDEIHEAMKNKTRRVPFGDRRIPILAPEHLVVCKVVFNRPKDWIDIEQVVAMVPQLNIDEIRNWLGQITGASASSSKRFETLVKRVLKD